ncbi:structural protein [Synechococcus phage ACG-2014d]|jgi:hypothetical protein|uniref:Structural protein n=1 Tax=Synechococcus phage ACG-2014d TaxID=1493509 RepID=A0A0E3HXS8_9CAUD|nr:tail fiber protein [Synechococcus phage ACG-2014d]AIX14857.1 structural protein [Synechococcus phage ACG-2014d]AIX18830.1 structural protein [Synechococcus phage ACG-2014d]AIX21131.1 structural protein [Synechococcus phage ACG-2014d]AIX25888.1 structural protein [Synechococcus phage ACG-2014d]AIX26106.1 structural protein [Synechococcus phage ACG-2014d]
MATNTGALANIKPSSGTFTTLFKNDVLSSTTGTVFVNCDGTGADTYNIKLNRWDQELTLDANTYLLHRGDLISNVKWTLSASIPLADAIPGTKFVSSDGEKCAYLLDVADPVTTTYEVRYKSLIAFTLENVADTGSSVNPDYANGETVSNGGGVSGVVYENIPGSNDDAVLWIGDITGGTFSEGDVLTGGSSTTSGTVSTGGIATAANRFVFNDGAGGAVFRLQNEIQPELLTDRVYKFDVANASMSGKILEFSDTNGGSNNSGDEFVTGKTVSGTPGQAGAFVQYNLTGAELISNFYPYDQADATYADDSQYFTFSEEYTFNEIYVYTQKDEYLQTPDQWIITDAFIYRDVTYAVDAIAGDSYGTILEWDKVNSKLYVANGPGSAAWAGSDTFFESPRQLSVSKATATINSVLSSPADDFIVRADAIAQETTERQTGIIIGPGQSIQVECTNGRCNFVFDAFQDTVNEVVTALYQRSSDYQTGLEDSGDGGDGGD